MTDALFLVGTFGVKPSDIIATAALMVSALALWMSWRTQRREDEKVNSQKRINCEVGPSHRDLSGAVHVKVYLVAPSDDSTCDLTSFEGIGSPKPAFALTGKELPITLKATDPQFARWPLNLTILNYDALGREPTIRIKGKRRDSRRSAISADFVVGRPERLA